MEMMDTSNILETPQRSKENLNSHRSFGTVLSVNSPKRIRLKSAKKETVEYTVIFHAGPIGLQLEPFGQKCRVQKFIDGGPKNPGPARLSGKINPGDIVVAVNKQPVTSYENTIELLKQTNQQREITFQANRRINTKSRPPPPPPPSVRNAATPARTPAGLPGKLRKSSRLRQAQSPTEIPMGIDQIESYDITNRSHSIDSELSSVVSSPSKHEDTSNQEDLQQQITELKTIAQERQQIIEDLQQQRDQQADRSRMQIREMRNELDKHRKEELETKDIIDRITNENEQLDHERQQAVDELKASREQYESRLTECQQEISQLRNQVEASEDNHDFFERLRQEKKVIVEKYKADLRRVHDERSEVVDQLQKARSEIVSLRDQLQESKENERVGHDFQFEDIKNQLRSLESSKDKEIANLRSKLHATTDKASRQDRTIDRLNKQIESLRSERAQLSVEEMMKMEDKLQKIRADHELELMEKSQEARRLQEQVDKLEGERLSYNGANDRRSDETNRLLKSMRQSLADSERRAGKIREELAHQRSVSENLRKSLASNELRLTLKTEKLETQCNSLTESLKEKESKLRELESELRSGSGKAEEISRLQADLAESEKEIQKLNSKLSDMKEKHSRKLKDSKETFARKQDRLEKEKLELEESLRQANEYGTQLQSLVNTYEEQVEQYRTEIDKLNDERRDMMAEVLELKDKIAELEADKSNQSNASSTFDDDEEFRNMSRTVLKHKCITLKHDIEDAESRLASAMADNGKRVQQIRRLEKDLEVISEENNRMVDVIASLETQFQSDVDSLKADLTKARDHWRSVNEGLQSRIEHLDGELSSTIGERDDLRRQLETNSAQMLHQLESIKAHRDTLLSQVTELESLNDRLKSENDESSAVEGRLRKQLQKAQQEASAAIEEKTNLTTRLADTTNEVCNLEEKLEELNACLGETESAVERLALKNEQLQVELESARSIAKKASISKVQSLERRCAEVESQRDEALSECQKLKEDINSTARQLEESVRSGDLLKMKVKDLEHLVKESQQDVYRYRQSAQETNSEAGTLRNEIDSKSLEIDHLKANIQVLNSNLARANADYKLLQKAALRAEFQQVAAGETKDEVARLKSELHTKNAKLKSMSEVFQSQRKVLALSNSLEEQLSFFIEEIIEKADEAFRRVSDKASDLEKFGGSSEGSPTKLQALDLAENGKAFSSSALKACIKGLCDIIPDALLDMEQKRAQLQAWKARRNIRLKETSGSDVSFDESESGDDKSGVQVALRKMKRVFNRDILSPGKARQCRENHINTEYLQSVIHSLESQIDGLLIDLKSANEALNAKDQVFADLEEVITRHEDERDQLEEQVRQLTNAVKEMEEKLSKESSWKQAAEAELAHIRDGIGNGDDTDGRVDTATTRKAAMHIVAAVCDQRDSQLKAKAMFQWFSQASAMTAIAQHGQVAAELAEQLQTTREKFLILKHRLKKPPKRATESKPPAMNKIIEGYETT